MRFRVSAIAFVAAPATLFGHALTYALGQVSLADGRHLYFLPALQALVTIAAVLALALMARSLLLARSGLVRGRPYQTALSSQRRRFTGSLTLWAALALTQSALFVCLETLEGYHTAAFGCLVQCLVALLATLVLCFFAALLDRCEQIGLALGTYLQRSVDLCVPPITGSLVPVPVIGLNERRGIRRFQRPPPSL